MAVSKEEFRSIMRQLAGGVCIISAQKDGKPFGLTSTAVVSVSGDPPSLLIGVNQAARTHEAIQAGGIFAVNILSEGQVSLSELFASQSNSKFEDMPYHNSEGCPILESTCGFALCEVTRAIQEGSHTIFLGRILKVDTFNKRPLLYHSGQYGSFLQAV